MTERRRQYRILSIYCLIGGLALAAAVMPGVLFPVTIWAVIGAFLLGAWVGFALYRLRSDALI
jgi:hypothetical protein